MAPLNAKERAAWDRIQPSIVMLVRAGNATGAAAMIDATGLFVAHADSVSGNIMEGRLVDGRMIKLQLRNSDGTTQLALLKVVGAVPNGMRPLDFPENQEQPGKAMFAILPSGPVRAEFVQANQVGRVGPSLRILPLSEIRFEKTEKMIGGALLVSYDREFMGTLYATLAGQQDSIAQGLFGGGAGGGFANSSFNAKAAPLQRQMGPAQMTVAYTVGPDVVRRVLTDFKSPGHEVMYPALGVFCRNANGGGALVQRVVEGGSADRSGIRLNDVILEINGTPIRSQIDFSRVMFRQKIGDRIPVKVRRGGQTMTVDVVVGKQSE